jgi:hypothetical protein
VQFSIDGRFYGSSAVSGQGFRLVLFRRMAVVGMRTAKPTSRLTFTLKILYLAKKATFFDKLRIPLGRVQTACT